MRSHLESNLALWLRANSAFGPHTRLIEATGISGGQSGDLTRFICRRNGSSEDECFVLRREPRAKQYFLKPDIVREYQVIDGVARSGLVPVPPLIALERDATVLGAPFLVMREMPGAAPLGRPSMHEVGMLTEIGATKRTKLAENGLAAMGAIHAVDWRHTHPFLADELGAMSGLDFRLSMLEEWYRWSAKGRPFDLCDRALAFLLKNRPDKCDEDVLLWGDARPGNILFNKDQSVSAVLDWEGALVGPAELDLGYWIMMDRFHTDMIGVERLPGWPSESETVSHYRKITGRDLCNLDYFILMGAFFIATTMIRAADLGIESGRLAPSTRMAHDNTATQIVARMLNLPEPDLSPDFVAHRGLDPVRHRVTA